jgi:hypothetical protein
MYRSEDRLTLAARERNATGPDPAARYSTCSRRYENPMMNDLQRTHGRFRRCPIISSTLPIGLVCALAGAAAPLMAGGDSSSGFDQITLAPGDTGRCDYSPCAVYLKMPEGEGTYEAMSSGDGSVGEYPAGKTVKLGSFSSSQGFTIKGMDVPKAYAYIGGNL